MQKLEEEVEDWGISLSTQDRPSVTTRLVANPSLAQRRPTKKPEGSLSANPVLSAQSPPYSLSLEWRAS